MIGRVVESLVRVARPIILEMFNKDSCIASTRIAIDALRYFGITAVPMSLSTTIYNSCAVEAFKQGKAIASIVNFQSALCANKTSEAWFVMIGTGLSEQDPNNPTWAGHLVAVIPDETVLIDLAIDQASRPAKNIDLEPFWLRIPQEDWWKGTDPVVEFSDISGSELVLDRRCSDPSGYLTSPNWDVPPEYADDFAFITNKVIRAMCLDMRLPPPPHT